VTFWATNAFIPAAVYMLNFIVRLKREVPLSSGADFIAVFLVFDFIALLTPGSFGAHIQYATLRDAAGATFGVLFFLGLIIWIATVLFLEPKFVNRKRQWTPAAAGCFCTSTAAAAGITFLHFALFVSQP
jgi:hypothetical protein